jgi:glycerophosphoryl diester phosphodiesterase
MAARHPFLDWPGPIPFAHRGGAGDAPENTMRAFSAAVILGYRYLETDVRVTADGLVVVFHDEDLARMCGRPGRISELSAAEIATARVAGTEPIPTLHELLDAWPDVRINIDCKSDDAIEPLADVITEHAALDRVCLSSFSDRRIRALRRRLGRRLCTSAATLELAALKLFGFAAGGLAAQVPVRHRGVTVVNARFVRRSRRRGLPVHVWTIDDASEMHRLFDLGVDGIMTDRPAVLRDVLMGRGNWHQ